MSEALARSNETELAGRPVSGSYINPELATRALTEAHRRAHLVSPAPACGTIPEGCEVSLSAVMVDAHAETYLVGFGDRKTPKPEDDVGLSKVALDKISAAAGISWDPVLSRRLDDGSHPHYCHFQAVGYIKNLDGTERCLSDHVELDLRDGSDEVEKIMKSARSKEKGETQLRDTRRFILRHAVTKARLRAIRSIGIRSSYKRKELAKPFVVARLQFTGHSEDPEARRQFRGYLAESFLGARSTAYGGGPGPARALPEAAPEPEEAHAPPPVGTVPASEGDVDTTGESDSSPRHAPPTDDRYDDGPPDDPTGGKLNPADFKVPGNRGKDRGKPLTEAADETLKWWADKIGEKLEEDPEHKFAEQDRKLLAAMRLELERRDDGKY